MRSCDHATKLRPSACEIFWTLGPNQVGKVAIGGWRDLLTPALRSRSILVWPFEGELAALLASGRIMSAETYPADAYGRLGFLGNNKRSREWRSMQARLIFAWCDRNRVKLVPEVRAAAAAGFWETSHSEDDFDSLVGLLGMIDEVRNAARFSHPQDPVISEIEGWILGMPFPSQKSLDRLAQVGHHSSVSVPPSVVLLEESMRITNHDIIWRMLDCVRRGLVPLVESRLRPQDKAKWLERWGRGGQWNAARLDAKGCLDAMHIFWERFQSEQMGRREHAWVNELISIRNDYAHPNATNGFSDDDTLRGIDTAHRLLAAVKSPEAAGVESLRKQLQEQSELAKRVTGPTGSESANAQSKLCPACGRKTFERWPWGWDGHAAYKCTGIEGSDAEERKRMFRERYLS